MVKIREKSSRSLLPWIGFVLVVLAVLYGVFSVTGSRALKESRAELIARGRPVDVAEILPKSIPESQNAAPVYDEVVRQLEELKGSGWEGAENLFQELNALARELAEDEPDPEAIDAFRRLYQQGAVAEALAAIEEGSMKEGYWQELDFSDPLHMRLDHLSDLMNLSYILAARARVQLLDGEVDGAWDSVATGLRLANALEQEPTIISQLVRAGSFWQALNAMKRLDPSTANAERLSDLRSLLRPFDNTAPYVAAMDGERVLGDHIFNVSSAELDGINDSSDVGFGTIVMMRLNRYLPPLRYRDRATRTQAMIAYTKALEEPYTLDDRDLDESIAASIPPSAVISRLTIPALGGVKDRMTTMIAETRVMEAGLAAIEYRQRHGENPPDLQALDLENLTDPFSGGDLLYVSEDDGMSIRSIGSNVADDGNGEQILWQFPGDNVVDPN